MKKQILGIMIGMFLISFASAVNITSGESYNITLPEEYDYYSIIGNTTEIDLILESDGLNITITIDKYQPADEFTLVFFNKDKEVIYRSSGGGSRTIYKENKTYVEVPTYIDREVYIDREIVTHDDITILNDSTILDESPGFTWWYFYILITIVIGIGVYLLMDNVKWKDKTEEPKE